MRFGNLFDDLVQTCVRDKRPLRGCIREARILTRSSPEWRSNWERNIKAPTRGRAPMGKVLSFRGGFGVVDVDRISRLFDQNKRAHEVGCKKKAREKRKKRFGLLLDPVASKYETRIYNECLKKKDLFDSQRTESVISKCDKQAFWRTDRFLDRFFPGVPKQYSAARAAVTRAHDALQAARTRDEQEHAAQRLGWALISYNRANAKLEHARDVGHKVNRREFARCQKEWLRKHGTLQARP